MGLKRALEANLINMGIKVVPEYLPLIAVASAGENVGEVPPDGLEPPTQALGRPRSVH